MNESKTEGQEGNDKGLIEDINQLKSVALGEGAVACQVCGSKLPDGSAVTVFAYRPAGQPTFEVGHVICGDNEHDLPTYFTLGVRELIVDGHVGRCIDPTTHSSWPILLEPSVRVVSRMNSKTGQIAPDSATDSSSEVSWVYGDALLERATDHDADTDPAGGSDHESRSPTKPAVADGMGHTDKNNAPTGSEESNETNLNEDGAGGEC